MYKESIDNPDGFWKARATETLTWQTDFNTVKNVDLTTGNIAWFLGGKLNASGLTFCKKNLCGVCNPMVASVIP